MCGITGYIVKKRRLAHPFKVLSEMMQIQKHRGPDDSGYAFIDRSKDTFSIDSMENIQEASPEHLFFGFNRLSILDLSQNGHQPMYHREAGVVFMLNGEIYNAFDYKDDLIKKGYVFKSTTDTEVALNLYLEYGLEGMLGRLNGMFAIAIYDRRVKKLLLIRDRYGIKPLYVLNNRDYLAFSSEIKSFKALPGFKFKLDTTNFDEFLLFRNLINRTLFKDIENIEPGMYWEIGPNNNPTKCQYYDINKEGRTYAIDDAKQQLENSLRAAVKRQMIADVKLGCQLSGGVDSSLITYYANGLVKKGSLETISIIPTEEGFSEEAYMNIVINQLGINAHKYQLDADYYFNNIDRVTWQFEQPLNHPNTIGIYQLSQQAKKHVTVLLSGEGADEVLGGYDRFVIFARPFSKLKYLLSKSKQNNKSLLTLYSEFLDLNVQMIMASCFTSLDALFAIYPTFDFSKAIRHRKSVLNNLEGETILKQRKYEIKTYLPDLLMRQDKMSMAHSIENRVPFLDNETVNTSLKVSREALLGKTNPIAKNILKEIASKKFTYDFAYRRKQGFPIPLKSFFASDSFQERWQDEILPSIRDAGTFDSNLLNKWVTNLNHLRPEQLDLLWLASGFEIWTKQYLK